jgi:hypothetical protein
VFTLKFINCTNTNQSIEATTVNADDIVDTRDKKNNAGCNTFIPLETIVNPVSKLTVYINKNMIVVHEKTTSFVS